MKKLFVSLLLTLAAFGAWAQTLSPAQLLVLRTSILADPLLAPKCTSSGDGPFEIAAAYNLPSTPDFWAWRTAVAKTEMTNSTSVDGTTFSWTGAGFITRSQGERNAWQELFSPAGIVNCSLPQVRQALQDIFSGPTAPAPANRTHLSTMCRRLVTRAERLFATGTGTTATPGLLVFEGMLSVAQAQAACTQ